MTGYPPTCGLILAGGRAQRMGGADKAKVEIGGVSILDRVIATLSAQCVGMAVNANGDPGRFAGTGLPVIADGVPGFAGPLAGVLAGLDWLAGQNSGAEWVLSVPCDCPFLPDDLAARLHAARREMGAGVPLAVARSGERRHPVIGLWPLALRADLRKALLDDGVRKVDAWTARYPVAVADWPDTPADPFFNVNTPDDAAQANLLAARMAGGG